jgi:nitroreductase/NAD-dependent dihydropyrimidine dehydrogenase PreA subunit
LGHFSVNTELCKKDGICSEVCPIGIIEFLDKNSFPSLIQGADELCIGCGHCVAVCPHGAAAMDSMNAETCQTVRKDILPGSEEIQHFLKCRRSIRKYRNKLVERKILEDLVGIAGFAPSGHNSRPVRWLVVEKKTRVKYLAELVVDWMRLMITDQPEIAGPMRLDRVVSAWEKGNDRVLRNAPHLIVAYADKNFSHSQTSCIISLCYLEMAAASTGLGACWAGYFNRAASSYPPLMQELGLPSDHQCYGAMMVGYRKYEYKRIPLRNEPQVVWMN